MRCSRVDNVLPVPGVKPLPPPSDVPVGMRSNTTVILATFPPEKTTVPRFPEIAHPVYQTTRLETHLPRLWDDPPHRERLLTTGADSQRRLDLVYVSCEPAGGLYPSAS